MVVPAPPAGGTDLVARLYSDLLGQELGLQVIVDNKGGGNGNIGTADRRARQARRLHAADAVLGLSIRPIRR